MSMVEFAAPAARTISDITSEILSLKQTACSAMILKQKQTAARSVLAIGQRLIEAKEMLPHGEWLPWLEERVEFPERRANCFMRLAREWSNPPALSDLEPPKP